MGKGKVIMRIIGSLLIIIALFYLFFPHSVHMDMGVSLGLEYYHNILLGSFLLVIGAILTLNGKRLKLGIFWQGFRKHLIWGVIIYVITFSFLFLFFNAGFELLSGDVNNLKIVFLKVSSVGLAIMLLIGIITGGKIFGIKSTRY